MSSWAAYPYAAAIAARAGTFGAAHTPRIDVSVARSDDWLGPLCRGDPQGPDLAYAFAPVGTVSEHPCPRSASGEPNPVVAIPVGYEAVALARSPVYGKIDLARREVFLALAKWVPDPAQPGTVHENPNRTWRQVDALPPLTWRLPDFISNRGAGSAVKRFLTWVVVVGAALLLIGLIVTGALLARRPPGHW